MKPQLPAEGILLHRDYGNAMTYIVACECGNGDCEHQVWIEAEATGIAVTTYTTQKTNYWSESVQPDYTIDDDIMRWYNWFWTGLWNGFTRRLILTKNIWFDGYVKYEANLMMSEQQALNYAETLKRAVTNVKEFRKDNKQKSRAPYISAE